MRQDKHARGIVNTNKAPGPDVSAVDGDQRKGSAGYAFAIYPTVEQVLADRRKSRA